MAAVVAASVAAVGDGVVVVRVVAVCDSSVAVADLVDVAVGTCNGNSDVVVAASVAVLVVFAVGDGDGGDCSVWIGGIDAVVDVDHGRTVTPPSTASTTANKRYTTNSTSKKKKNKQQQQHQQ